jgi:hypothetical protein
LLQRILPTNHMVRPRRSTVRIVLVGGSVDKPPDRSREPVAPSGHILDKLRPLSAFPKCLSEEPDVNLKGGPFDPSVRPNTRDYFRTRHDFAGVIQQNAQYIERPRSQSNLLASSQQEPLARQEAIRAECNGGLRTIFV